MPASCFEVYAPSPPDCWIGIPDCSDPACSGMFTQGYARYVDSGCGW
jgi:hypothetical protein